MREPKRWLDEGGMATAFERELLRSGFPDEPPEGAKAAVWGGVLAALVTLPPPGGAGGGGLGHAAPSGTKLALGTKLGAAKAGSGLASATASAGILKAVAVGSASAILCVAGYSAVEPSAAPPPAASVTTSSSVHDSVRPKGQAPEGRQVTALPADPHPEPVREDSAPSTAGKSKAIEPFIRETALREESQRIAEARDILRQGNAAQALTLLDRVRARFPTGVLGQEREALTIEALYRSGRRDEAKARAQAFLEAHPRSPFSETVRAFGP